MANKESLYPVDDLAKMADVDSNENFGSSNTSNKSDQVKGNVSDLVNKFNKVSTEGTVLTGGLDSGKPKIPKKGNAPQMEFYESYPVQLYKCIDGKYFLDIKAMEEVFGKVSDKLIAIYTISGKYRSGKSFMLANFLKYLKFGERPNWIDIQTNDSFKHENREQRVTEGIWIWSEPIIKKTEHGREVALFLMDTQGWHDEFTNTQDNALVFALSSLLSSVMIFNTEKRIGEDDLQYFQSFSTTAKLIDAKNKDEPFQKLIFLVRDWQFPQNFDYGYYDDNTSIGGNNFKLSKINPQSTQNIDARSIREIIMATYQHISAFLMPYPGAWIQTGEFKSSEAQPLFVSNMVEFITGLFADNGLVPKKIGGKYVTGRDLIESAKVWAEEFKYVPKKLSKTLPFSFSSVDETYYLLAYQTSLDYFDEKMKKSFGICSSTDDLYDLLDEQRDIVANSLKIFQTSNKLTDSGVKGKFEKKLMDELKEREKTYTKIIKKGIQLKESELDKLKKEQVLQQFEAQNAQAEIEQIKLIEEIRAEVSKVDEKVLNDKKNLDEKLIGFQTKRRTTRKKWFGKIIGSVADFFGIN